MIDIKHKKVEIFSCDIRCLETGAPEGQPVIVLHGMKFNSAIWYELGTLAQLSSAGFYVLAVDLPGFGSSPPCAPSEQMVLKTLIQKLGLVKPVMIGPSMGGRIALECAIRWPELLGGLVLVGAVGVRENEAELATIKVPTLIVRGGNDQISPLINSEILNRSIAGSRKVIIDDTAHPCYVEDPDSWHALLLDFMVTEFIGKRVLKQVAGPSEPQAWSLFRTPA